MECLQIDWENLDHTFERDDFYESIQAPKWIDFTVPLRPVDDHEWFCGKAGCTHVKPPEDPFQQKNLCLQASKKVPPLVESTLSVAPGKRAREVVASSYSSMSSIKEAFAKHKLLHAAKTSIAESNKQAAIRRPMHASENQKPNQACEVPPGGYKAPDVLAAKKPKTTGNKQIFGISESMVLSEQKNRSQNRAVLDVAKSMTSIGKKDLGLKRSTASRFDAKTSNTDAKEEETAGPTATLHTFEPKNKRAEASRIPFSTYTTSRTALTSSLALPSRRPIYPARSIQNVQLDNNKSVLCRPPRVVVRKDHKLGVEQMSMPDKQASGDNAASSTLEDLASRDVETNANLMLQQQCSALDHENFLKYDGQLPRDCKEEDDQLLRDCKEDDGQHPRDCKEDEKDENIHALASEHWQSVQMTLEQHLKSLCLATPGKKLTSNGNGNPEHTDNPQKQEVVLHAEDLQDVTNAVELETVLSKDGHVAAECSSRGAAGHEEVLITDCIHSGQVIESQINESSACSMDITEEQDGSSIDKQMEKKDNQLQPVKGWHNNRGLKRKSCELNFKVNCSAKDHRHESPKVTSSVAFVSSLLCQQAKPVSMLRSPLKAPPSSLGCFDSCKEQHKKMKITKVQPFKPFRLRTEERGALKELGIGKKEQGTSNPQELVHHALRMPSFGHPFRPQRSTKKLTIPKEPNFHTRTRKACSTRHHTTMIAS